MEMILADVLKATPAQETSNGIDTKRVRLAGNWSEHQVKLRAGEHSKEYSNPATLDDMDDEKKPAGTVNFAMSFGSGPFCDGVGVSR